MQHHVFISYAHLDNIPADEETKGWITRFHDALKSFLGQYYGETPLIWRDPKIDGNMLLREAVFGSLLKSAALVSVLSPRYMTSDWCSDELNTFCEQIDIYVDNRTRVFKVLKMDVPLVNMPEIFHETKGYQFYEIAETGKPDFYNPDFGEKHRQKFLYAVSDLAQDITELLQELKTKAQGGQ